MNRRWRFAFTAGQSRAWLSVRFTGLRKATHRPSAGSCVSARLSLSLELFVEVAVERMMGLEPTTFCMASRRSSQLSYIRVGRAF